MQIFKNGGSIIMQMPFKEITKKLNDILSEDKSPTIITIIVYSSNENTINKIIINCICKLKKKKINSKITRVNNSYIYIAFITFEINPDIDIKQYNFDKFLMQIIKRLYYYKDITFNIEDIDSYKYYLDICYRKNDWPADLIIPKPINDSYALPTAFDTIIRRF